jgi:hypothetical protein
MVTAVSLTDAEPRRSPKAEVDVVDFIGGHQQLDGSPQGFLVDVFTARHVIKPHFHLVDQFQVIVSGDGKFGKHPISAGALHYADAYTPYGPIVAGDKGLAFFTLRARADTGIHYMPGSRHEMKRNAGRNLAADASPVVGGGDARSTLFEDSDGVRAVRLQAQGGKSLQVPAVKEGGAYLVVISGSLKHDAREIGAPACFFIQSGTKAFSAQAGPEGAVAVLLQFAIQPSKIA